jgi:HK97 gp10 family phage protein
MAAKLKSRLPEIAAELAPKMDAVMATTARTVEAKAKARVSVDTGRLRSRIHVERTGIAEYMVIAGDDQAFYGHIVEHGGAHTPARPFLVPSLEDTRREIRKFAAEALRSL